MVRSDLGTAALNREVAALRCGLDHQRGTGRGERCGKILKGAYSGRLIPGKPLPFDLARAHKLYSALFGEVQDLIKDKHLLIVPSGPLTQLPFQVLVTKAPTSGDHRAVAWLAREHAVTVLPAVSSLKALRRVGRPSAAPRPMIGFGNPLLDGPDGSSQTVRSSPATSNAARRRARNGRWPPRSIGRWRRGRLCRRVAHKEAATPAGDRR